MPDLYWVWLITCQLKNLQSPSIELEYLANYLAELTLMNYGFLNFFPSMIAASVVFLARWTLDQSRHPWVGVYLSCFPSIWSYITQRKHHDLHLYEYFFCRIQLLNTMPLTKHQIWKPQFLHYKIYSWIAIIAIYLRSVQNTDKAR